MPSETKDLKLMAIWDKMDGLSTWTEKSLPCIDSTCISVYESPMVT